MGRPAKQTYTYTRRTIKDPIVDVERRTVICPSCLDPLVAGTKRFCTYCGQELGKGAREVWMEFWREQI